MGMRGLGKTGVSGTTPVVGGARQGVPAKTPYVVTSGWLNGGGYQKLCPMLTGKEGEGEVPLLVQGGAQSN